MEERALREIRWYSRTEWDGDREEESIFEKEFLKWREQLFKEGITIEILSFLPPVKREEESGVLYLTDCELTASYLEKAGYPVLGFSHEGNRQETFSDIRFLAESWEALEADYLEQVYRRYKKLPWHILSTKRCQIRETIEEDVDAFYRIYEAPSITRYMEGLYEDREEERRYITEYRRSMYEFYGFGIWTVILRGTGEIIGRAGITLRSEEELPELGFVIGVPWQNQGIAKEVCRAILVYGRDRLYLDRIQAFVEQGNQVSERLLIDLGFIFQGEYEEQGKQYLRFGRAL